jgi:HEAT repeat protein
MPDVPLLGQLAERLAERRNRREQIPAAAAEFLANMRNHANSFVPELVRIYQDPKRSEEVINRAAEVLTELGPDAGSAMPSFLEHLRGTDVTHKPLTVSILSAIGPPAWEAVPVLTSLLNGEGSNDLIVAEALWTIDRRTNETVTACLRILQVPPRRFNEELAREVLELLARMGPAASEVIPVLRHLVLEAPGTMRFPAELALRSIDAPALDQLYVEANATARHRIEKIVAALGRQDIWTPTPERTNFFRALPSIAALGPDAKTAVPRLVEVLTTMPPEGSIMPGNIGRRRFLFHAAQALGQIGEASEAVVGALAGKLQTANPMVARACCEALGQLGPPARAAVPALLPFLQAPDAFLRLDAAMALVSIAPDTGPTIIPTLRELEFIQDLRIRNAARIVRWRIEQAGPSPIEDLLSTNLTDLYLDKIKLAGWLGPEAKAALPELIGVVTTNRLAPLRLRAAGAIRRIDPATYHKLNLPGPLALPDIAIE